jgi:hypothetical protein
MIPHSRLAALSLVALAFSSAPAAAQPPSEPLPMGVPYVYQYDSPDRTFSIWPYWSYRPVAYGANSVYGYPSYYPFGATGPVFGRYSWDYSAYYAAGMGWYTENLPSYPYPIRYSGALYLQYPTYSYNRAWTSTGW